MMFLHKFEGDDFSHRNLYDYQSDIITELANRESCIIVGRCANYILRNNPDAVKCFCSCTYWI